MKNERKLLSVGETARELRVSEGTIWNWIKAGKIKRTRIGSKLVRIHKDEINKFIEQSNESNNHSDSKENAGPRR